MLPYQNLSLEDMPGEVWKDIPGLNGLYMASSEGRIKSLKKIVNGRLFPESIIRQRFNRGGYLTCHILRKQALVSRIITLAFHDRVDGKDFVDHINGVKYDNRALNLRWVTRKENAWNPVSRHRFMRWVYEVGQPTGADHHNARAVIGINIGTKEIRKYPFIRATAKDGFTPSNVSGCCRKAWATTLGWKFFYADDPELTAYLTSLRESQGH